MLGFILRRLVYSVVVILAVIFFLSILVKLVPGDAVDVMMASNAGYTDADVAALREQLGVDRPPIIQFVRYVTDLAQGNLGESIHFRRPVSDLLLERLQATVELAAISLVLALIVAVPLGMVAALRQSSIWDYGATFFSILGVAIPSFLVGILLILLLSVKFGLLPPSGRQAPIFDALFAALAKGDFSIFWAGARYYVMPALALALSIAAVNSRLIRSAVLETRCQDYVLFAKAKGLKRWRVNLHHILRNALVPAVTIFGLQIGQVISGAFIIENVFAWPGLGRLAVEAINARDFPLIQGTVLISALLFVFTSLLVDVLYSVLDPRVQYGSA